MKYAAVTGSTRGIGLAVAQRLAADGYYVYGNGTSAKGNKSNILDGTENGRVIEADLSTEKGAEQFVNSVLADNVKLDVLVLNVGATCRKLFCETGCEDWRKVLDTNVVIPALVVRMLKDHLNVDGVIIFIGSAMGIYPHASSVPYSVSKAAVHMLAQSLAKEFSENRVRVNAIAPGFIDTDWQKEKPQWLRDKIEEKILLKRFGTPEEVADACKTVIDAGYMNGTVVSVDGGYDKE